MFWQIIDLLRNGIRIHNGAPLPRERAEALKDRGNQCLADDDAQRAEAFYREAILADPLYAEAYNNLGAALKDQGRLNEAVKVLEQAISLRPNFAKAHFNLGRAHEALWNIDQAIHNYRQATLAEPGFAEAHCNLGVMLGACGQMKAALDCYGRALELKPDYVEAYSNRLFTAQYIPASTAAERLADAQAFAERFEAPLRPRWSGYDNAPDPERRLKVGLVSGDFRAHPVGYFLESILEHLSRQAFEVVLYSTHTLADSLTERLRSMAASWVSLAELSDDEAAARVREDRIDILVDLAGHTAFNRLLVFARRPAPVQVAWLGYCSTTGLRSIDYILCDRHVIPPEETRYFVEKPFYLPDSYLCFTPPDEDVAVGPLPAFDNGHITFGCFNSITKMNDAVVALWAKVLKAVEGSRLFLKSYQFKADSLQQATRERFAAHGIGRERLIIEGPASRKDYLAAYGRVDIALDPFPFPGGTTTVESLWMGVPVLNLRGDRFIAHAGESILCASGLPEWIAADECEYVAKALALSGDSTALAELRSTLRLKLTASPMCDAKRFARHLEAAWRQMWRDYCETPAPQPSATDKS